MEYPPPLATVLFGFDRPAEEFRASYNCDEQGKQYLELKASDRKWLHLPVFIHSMLKISIWSGDVDD